MVEKKFTIAQEIDSYSLEIDKLVVSIKIVRDTEGMMRYIISLVNISRVTNIILRKIREEFISKVNIGAIDLADLAGDDIQERFKKEIYILIKKYFPSTDEKTTDLLISYIIRQNVGLGDIEILLKDSNTEEIVINSSKDPVRMYHRKHKWLITNIYIESETKIRHMSTLIGRHVGREITVLSPIMDAHLKTGDRVNATLMPISDRGNTITIRKFSDKPWTITDFIKAGSISFEAAALVWLGIENEFSMLIAGGTGSGKTSMLNVLSNFFPPTQRIISIEDTRELTLAETLHWVPMATRQANPEGKGEISMLDLVVNALRQRPDRIVVGEIRRKKEAEVLFEAMHTGHSVYGTIHANTAEETIQRLTNPPIDIPKVMLSALSMIIVQHRNRRTGKRRTLQIAEITPQGTANVIYQHNAQKDTLDRVGQMATISRTLNLFTGMDNRELMADLKQKEAILRWLAQNNITDVHKIGELMAKYYLREKKK